MKRTICRLALLLAAFLPVACEGVEDDFPTTKKPAVIRVTTAPMSIIGEQLPYTTRAVNPLPPEIENTINSLAIFVFDVREGVLRRFPAEGLESEGKFYRYTNLVDANGDGLLNTTLPVSELPIYDNNEYTVCLIANLPETTVESIVARMLEDGTGFIDEFKAIAVAIPYYGAIVDGENTQQSNLEQGHVSSVYMFGYYQGRVSGLDEIDITLGRVISRLEIVFTIADDARLNPDYTFYGRMKNLESTAFLFPRGISPGGTITSEVFALPSLEEKTSTMYAYVAPSSAATEAEALTLELWYAPRGLTTEGIETLGTTTPNAAIQLCNDLPDVADRNYQLNRNSVYRFNLTLANK